MSITTTKLIHQGHVWEENSKKVCKDFSEHPNVCDGTEKDCWSKGMELCIEMDVNCHGVTPFEASSCLTFKSSAQKKNDLSRVFYFRQQNSPLEVFCLSQACVNTPT